MAEDFKYEITEYLGVISEAKSGWKLELNMVSWGEREPKFDLRSWSQDHQKMGKGTTFTKEEIISLRDLLNKLNFD
ncbi:MAG: YdbC family protein [Treponemataceae bacterium]